MKKNTGFEKLSFQKKIEYLWDYYRYHFLACAAGLLLLIYMLHHAMAEKPFLNVIMVDPLLTEESFEENSSDGFADFESQYGGGKEVSVSALYLSENVMSQQALSTMVGGGGNDIMIGTEDELLGYAARGAFMDLSEVLPEELLEQYQDQLVFCDYYDDLGQYPCVVRITDSQWLSKFPYYMDECYVGILYRGEHPEAAAEWMHYLLTLEKF